MATKPAAGAAPAKRTAITRALTERRAQKGMHTMPLDERAMARAMHVKRWATRKPH